MGRANLAEVEIPWVEDLKRERSPSTLTRSYDWEG